MKIKICFDRETFYNNFFLKKLKWSKMPRNLVSQAQGVSEGN